MNTFVEMDLSNLTTTLSIFGSSGSIGRQTLDVVRDSKGRFEILALSVDKSLDLLVDQIREFHPKIVVVANEVASRYIQELFPALEVRFGPLGLYETAREADVSVNAVVGFAGLWVTLGALEAGKRLALANKESLVAGGPVVRRVRSTPGAMIVPIDSEHGAIHQCLRGGKTDEVDKVILTSSGGPFRTKTYEELTKVTLEEALNHPTWKMGPKITVDSSTLMNKALEIIEAVELFDLVPSQVEVVVHAQSIVHSMVAFRDGSILAQMSRPDMKLPIAYAINYPGRFEPIYGPIDFQNSFSLSFEPPRRDIFRGLDFAFDVLRNGNGATTWLNAINEVVVAAYLDGRFQWLEIYPLLEDALARFESCVLEQVDDVIALDEVARVRAQEVVDAHSKVN
ncbi:1-deoxy-D-xylulose-5-phosphate reductoisomerase [Acidithrix sp. C25]|uniref:1-deoxy-D-xylulose-5-phosphate reductoisomerase n=1 Tax=Acidithrix sp. C25 TaxID=1671482 RepID=UPI001BBCD103|nr:1-deoxy-D-xylulose-5-phosphate reductoisomerase [Acidithrix sp. C25]CAG4900453.1 unnamed protein product [Acidithrix sp. C25]